MESNIELFVEVPEVLHQSLQAYLDDRPDWDQNRIMSAALSLFLLQSRPANERQDDKATARVYLDAIFKRPVELEMQGEAA